MSPCSPEIKGRVPLPPSPSKIRYLMFPVPHYYLCSSVSIKSWLYFPHSRKINDIFPVPKTPGRASSRLNFRFSLNKIRRLQFLYSWITILLNAKKHKRSRSNVLYDDSSGSSSKQEKDERKLLVGPLSSWGKAVSILLPRNKSDHIYFIILFYYHVSKSLFNRSLSRFYSTYVYYNKRSSYVNYVFIISMGYVRPAKPQTSLHICTVRSEPLLVAWKPSPCGSLSLPQSEQSQWNENGLLLLDVPLKQ